MHIGYDIDGVLTRRDATHVSIKGARFIANIAARFFPELVRKWTLSQPLQEDIEIAREFAKHHTISIITARPQAFHMPTEQWLKDIAQIDYNHLYCVGLEKGFGKRKADIAKQVQIDVFLDDTESTIDLFRTQGLDARLFTSWKDIQETLIHDRE